VDPLQVCRAEALLTVNNKAIALMAVAARSDPSLTFALSVI
jgi:hypothetical protein